MEAMTSMQDMEGCEVLMQETLQVVTVHNKGESTILQGLQSKTVIDFHFISPGGGCSGWVGVKHQQVTTYH